MPGTCCWGTTVCLTALLDSTQTEELVKVSTCRTQELAVPHELFLGAVAGEDWNFPRERGEAGSTLWDNKLDQLTLSVGAFINTSRAAALERSFGYIGSLCVSFPSAECHSSCRTCQGTGPFSCTSCDADLVLSHLGTCSTACFPGHYLDDSRACQRRFLKMNFLSFPALLESLKEIWSSCFYSLTW